MGEYVSEVLNESKFHKRAKKYSKDDAQHFYFMALSSEHFIDASLKGNISRFINHSCNPNSETQKWTVNGELRVGFFSRRPIAKGDEITFDYKYERYGQEAQKCYCGADNCRGWLGGNPEEDGGVLEVLEDEEEVEEETTSASEESSEDEEEVPEKPATGLEPMGTISVETKEPFVEVEEDEYLPPVTSLDTSDEFLPDISDPVMPSVKPLPASVSVASIVKVASSLPKPKKMKRKKIRKSPRKIKNFDADDHEEKLDKLKSTGIRTKDHTLDLSRRMLQNPDLNTKLSLCELLRKADAPCKRLFIDYRGLQTLGHWMTELRGQNDLELNLMESVEDVLAVLNIPDKQVLNETGLWQTISKLAAGAVVEVIEEVWLICN